jgi:hypothetical protein
MATDMTTDTTTNRWSGWVLFAGVMLMVAGGTRIIDGLWALKRDNDLENAPALEELLVLDDNLAAWGWFYVILGVLLIIAGFAVFSGAQWARWFGIVFASIAIFTHFAWMYAFPVQALVGVVIDSLVLYALVAYGGRDEVY